MRPTESGAQSLILQPRAEKGGSVNHFELSKTEQNRRKELIKRVRFVILDEMNVEAQDETSLMLTYNGYYLQISFSELHPLMVFCLAKAMPEPLSEKHYGIVNDLNLKSVLGSHSVNEEIGCYSYRATHWLDTDLPVVRFYEILDRCIDEAARGYNSLTR